MIPNIWNGTMFGDLDWPLNASCGLSAIAKFLVTHHHTCTWLELSSHQGQHLSCSLHSVSLQEHHWWTLLRNNLMQSWAQCGVQVCVAVQVKQGQHHTAVTKTMIKQIYIKYMSMLASALTHERGHASLQIVTSDMSMLGVDLIFA